jgi:hypothetical protein
MARAELPIVGQAVDGEVQKYVEGLVYCVLGSLHGR